MDPDSPDDVAAALERAAGGDEHAWRAVVGAFAPRVFGLIRSQCGDPELAEEIVQSSFCTVASKMGGYREFGRFDSWVFRIAMNRLRDEMRRRKRQARPMEAPVMADLVGGREEEADAFDRADRIRLAEALASLSERDRQIIDLRHVGGMSFKEMASHLEEPVGTLLARHHRALRKLRTQMGLPVEPGKDDAK